MSLEYSPSTVSPRYYSLSHLQWHFWALPHALEYVTAGEIDCTTAFLVDLWYVDCLVTLDRVSTTKFKINCQKCKVVSKKIWRFVGFYFYQESITHWNSVIFKKSCGTKWLFVSLFLCISVLIPLNSHSSETFRPCHLAHVICVHLWRFIAV